MPIWESVWWNIDSFHVQNDVEQGDVLLLFAFHLVGHH